MTNLCDGGSASASRHQPATKLNGTWISVFPLSVWFALIWNTYLNSQPIRKKPFLLKYINYHIKTILYDNKQQCIQYVLLAFKRLLMWIVVIVKKNFSIITFHVDNKIICMFNYSQDTHDFTFLLWKQSVDMRMCNIEIPSQRFINNRDM